MPRLAICVHDLSATGVVRNALAVAQHLHVAGWGVTVIVCRGEGALAGEAAGLDVRVLRPGPRGSTPRPLDLLRSVPALRQALTALQADVCLSAGNHAHLPCWLATRSLPRLPVVYRISNDLGHGQPAGPFSLRRLGTRLFLDDAARAVLVSPALGRDPALARALAAGRAVVIVNGVDVEAANRRAADPDFQPPWPADDTPTVLAVGRLVRQKNFATLVRAAALAHAVRPLRLVIVGDGSDRERQRLIRLAAECGLGERLILPGPCGNPFAAMRRADVVAVPSLWEGASNVLLEALAVGTPVVASSSAGNAADVLAGGRHGRLVEPHDAEAMAAALLRQLDPAQRVTPGDRARAFERRDSLEQYRQVLASLVPSTHPHHDAPRHAPGLGLHSGPQPPARTPRRRGQRAEPGFS